MPGRPSRDNPLPALAAVSGVPAAVGAHVAWVTSCTGVTNPWVLAVALAGLPAAAVVALHLRAARREDGG